MSDSSNTTERVAPTCATSTDTGRAPADDEMQRHALASRHRLRPAVSRHGLVRHRPTLCARSRHDRMRRIRSGAAMSVQPPAVELVERPDHGRIVTRTRPVRLGDVDARARLRLDATARYLQDVATDDATDADLDDAFGWVVRRTLIDVRRAASLDESLELSTFCSGTGRSWAERRTSIVGESGRVHRGGESVDPRRPVVGTTDGLGRRLPRRLRRGRGRAAGVVTAPPPHTARQCGASAVDDPARGHRPVAVT